MQYQRLLVLAVIAGTAGTAVADDILGKRSRTEGPRSRAVGASSRLVGCSTYPHVQLHCQGVTPTRIGLNVAEGEWRKDGGTSPMGMLQMSASPTNDRLASQVIATAGIKQRLGRQGYFHAGIGVAARQTARGPKTISSRQVMMMARPAFSVGIGADVSTKLDHPLSFALDVGSSFEAGDSGRTYQALASVKHRF